MKLVGNVGDDATKAAIQKQVDEWQKTAARYRSEPETHEGTVELAERAKEIEHARDKAIARYHSYEFASAAFQIAIVLASATIITGMVALALDIRAYLALRAWLHGARVVCARAAASPDVAGLCQSAPSLQRRRQVHAPPNALQQTKRPRSRRGPSRRRRYFIRCMIGSTSSCARRRSQITQSWNLRNHWSCNSFSRPASNTNAVVPSAASLGERNTHDAAQPSAVRHQPNGKEFQRAEPLGGQRQQTQHHTGGNFSIQRANMPLGA